MPSEEPKQKTDWRTTTARSLRIISIICYIACFLSAFLILCRETGPSIAALMLWFIGFMLQLMAHSLKK